MSSTVTCSSLFVTVALLPAVSLALAFFVAAFLEAAFLGAADLLTDSLATTYITYTDSK